MMAESRYGILNEQVFAKWGLSVTFPKIAGPLLIHDGTDDGHGFVEGTMTFSDPNKFWLIGVPDQDAQGDEIDSAFNWIHSPDTVNGADPDQKYEKVLQGIWGPYYLSSHFPHGPVYNYSIKFANFRQNLNSIDVVITRDKSKWTRCVVVEANICRL